MVVGRMIKNVVLLYLVGIILLTECLTLFVLEPRHYHANVVLAIVYLFISGLLLYDFAYKRKFPRPVGVLAYGMTSVLALVFAEAITLLYTAHIYPTAFPHPYTSNDALASALVLITSYGYPRVTGQAHGVVVLLMVYSWLVNVLLLSKLISLLQRNVS